MSLTRILKIATKAAGRAMRRRAEGTPAVPFLAALVYGFAAGAVLTLTVTAGSEGTAGAIANGSAYRIVRDLVVLIGTIIALTIAAKRARAHLAQAKAQTAAIDRQTDQIRLSRRGQVSSRFTEAVRQLGDPSLTIRMGGIAGLWSIAEEPDNHGDRRMVLDMLCAFVRRPTPDDALDSKTGAQAQAENDSGDGKRPPAFIRPDVMMAMTKLVSVGLDLSREDKDDGKDYEKDLTGAWLPEASLNHTHLERANLSEANLVRVRLFEAKLSEAKLRKTNLSEAMLPGANLFEANLSEANLSGASLPNAGISKAHLSKANLSGAHLFRANLSGAYLFEAYLSEADLSEADLSGAKLSGANLSGADLSGANLSGANLSGAKLPRANLSGAYLSKADLSGADLKSAKMTHAQYDSAITDEDTVPPDAFLDDV